MNGGCVAPGAGRTPNARLYVWDDRFLWLSRDFKGSMTRRYAANVVLALTDKPFLLRLPRKSALPCWAALCSPRALRCIDATDTPFLSLNLDPDCNDARLLDTVAQGRPVTTLPTDFCLRHRPELLKLLDGEMHALAARAAGNLIVYTLAGPAPVRHVDARVQDLLCYLRQHQLVDIDLTELAQRYGLSPSRLAHLFTEQVGLPMSQFLLWMKMRQAVAMIQGGRSLTEIAQACGFSDSSHLTRTFKNFYGIQPSRLANSNYVQVMLCERE
ncbi:AraC family transcriptional regulator [Fontimonas sp. SYSU GA230001]|uniref:helix-turn-helix transcriptional regulator n=1 Tax=Fontimonas sp. SYSU GA230001 TaxID=3142450 RepID=UPI0032B4BD4B